MPFWNANSTTLDNKVMYVNNTYKDASGKNKLTTITATNTTGYRDVLEGSTARIGDKPPGLKGLSYAVQTDGKITYKYDDGTGNIKQYNSIQEFANSSIVGYDENTTLRIKDSMQKNLKSGVDSYNAANPSSKINANQATTAPQTGDGSQPASQQEQEEFIKEAGSARSGTSTKENYEDLRYPEQLRSESQDCIKFSIVKYKPSGLSQKSVEQVNQERIVTIGEGRPSLGKREILGTITLPIPAGISDSNTVDWSSDNLDEITKAFANIAQSTITGGAESGGKAVGETAAAAQAGSKDLQVTAASKFTEMATGASSIMQRQYGTVQNPNMELLFKGPGLRSFTFTFRLSPRNKKESISVRKIIRSFKRAMSVKRTSQSLLLKSPHTFAIAYITSNGEHRYLNRFKECALTQCNVSYTPDNTYMTFAGPEASMTSYELQLQFQELVPLFDDEYGDNNNIGF